MPAKHRDVSEDDYPTGPIDVWPLLAADAPSEAFVVDANGARHAKGDGRFVRKVKAMWTWAEVQKLPPGSEHGPDVFHMPDEPGVEWETESFANGAVTISRPKGLVTSFRVDPPRNRKPIPPDPATIRAWAQRNNIPVSNRGKLSQAVIDAYMKARG